MTKKAVFTLKLERELRDEFMAEAVALDRPASQVVRGLMREFVRSQREARLCGELLRHKVDAGRREIRAGDGRFQAEVEADFAARRATLLRRARKAGT